MTIPNLEKTIPKYSATNIYLVCRGIGKRFSIVLKKCNLLYTQIPESRKEWMLDLFKNYGDQDSNNKDYKVWQSGNHPTLLWTLKHMWTNLDYIHNNPVKAGYVLDPKDYIYSSAISYEDESKGLLNRFVTGLRSC